MLVELVYVLNMTPDSFSDTESFAMKSVRFPEIASYLRGLGVQYIDIGGVASGPTSHYVDVYTEWARIEPALGYFLGEGFTVSIDTYNLSTAKRAITKGAHIINDIGIDNDSTEIADYIADKPIKYIRMFKGYDRVHDFLISNVSTDTIIGEVQRFFERFTYLEDRLIVDPGWGAFLSNDPTVTDALIRDISKLRYREMMIAISRKGFLRRFAGFDIDELSAYVGLLIVQKLAKISGLEKIYIRTHAPDVQKRYLDVYHHFCRHN